LDLSNVIREDELVKDFGCKQQTLGRGEREILRVRVNEGFDFE
jgi:hypothetical protein